MLLQKIGISHVKKPHYLLIAILATALFSCSDDSTIVDQAMPDLPLSFRDLTLSDYAFDTDSISIQPGVDKKPEDAVSLPLRLSVMVASGAGQSERSVQEVRCRVVADAGSSEKTSMILTGGNSVYTGSLTVPIRRGDVGSYRVIVEGKDDRGNAINPIFTTFTVLYGNNPPSFCGHSLPDTVEVPASGSRLLHLEICVTDSSGLGDIKRVFFNSYLPNGQGARDNPILMYDDGTRGDRIAGDGQFSRDVELPSTALKGTYRYEFYAYDLSKLQSDVLIHYLYVK